jgi:hypothetical protein
MTEEEWLACTDLQKMLEFLRGRASARKLRLFACACCRSTWHLLTDERSRRAVEVAERYADGEATGEEMAAARAAAEVVALDPTGDDAWEAAEAVARDAAWDAAEAVAWKAAWAAARAAWDAAEDTGAAAWDAASAALLRDIFGNPFRRVRVESAWLAWQGGIVPRLAQAAYEHRHLPEGHLDPARLAVLADALEDAGCQDDELLGHLRGPGPHVRGCWVVDQLLGRQ